MAGSLNRACLLGNIGRDPEIRSSSDGRRIANLSLATSDTWNDKSSGEKRERTEWHRVVIFNERLVEIVEKYVRKGSKLYVEGAIQTRKWTDNAGVDKYSTEIVISGFDSKILLLGDSGGGGGNRPPPAEESDYGGRTTGTSGTGASRSARQNDLDDEIPF